MRTLTDSPSILHSLFKIIRKVFLWNDLSFLNDAVQWKRNNNNKKTPHKLKGSHCATQKHTKYIKYSWHRISKFSFQPHWKKPWWWSKQPLCYPISKSWKIVQIPIEVFNHIILHYRMKNCAIKRLGQITEIPIVLW